jgi:F0F1-type ATP synthase assembly protein I
MTQFVIGTACGLIIGWFIGEWIKSKGWVK